MVLPAGCSGYRQRHLCLHLWSCIREDAAHQALSEEDRRRLCRCMDMHCDSRIWSDSAPDQIQVFHLSRQCKSSDSVHSLLLIQRRTWAPISSLASVVHQTLSSSHMLTRCHLRSPTFPSLAPWLYRRRSMSPQYISTCKSLQPSLR